MHTISDKHLIINIKVVKRKEKKVIKKSKETIAFFLATNKN